MVLVDARDTDPGEHTLLAQSQLTRMRVQDLHAAALPDGPLYLHVDVDVCDPEQVPDLLYPVPGGPALADVLAAVARVMGTGRVAAVGVAATWRHDSPAAPAHRDLTRSLAQASRG